MGGDRRLEFAPVHQGLENPQVLLECHAVEQPLGCNRWITFLALSHRSRPYHVRTSFKDALDIRDLICALPPCQPRDQGFGDPERTVALTRELAG